GSAEGAGRRIGRRQIAPALERPPRAQNSRHQLMVDLDQAIGAAILIALAAKPGDALAHADLTADHPVDRAAGEHLLDAAWMVAGIDPAGAALLEARGTKPAQFVDTAAPEHHPQPVKPRLGPSH